MSSISCKVAIAYVEYFDNYDAAEERAMEHKQKINAILQSI